MWSRELKRCQGCFEKSRRWVCAAKSGMVWAKCETICWSEYYSVSKYPYVLVFSCTCCKCASEEQVCVCKPSNVLLHQLCWCVCLSLVSVYQCQCTSCAISSEEQVCHHGTKAGHFRCLACPCPPHLPGWLTVIFGFCAFLGYGWQILISQL